MTQFTNDKKLIFLPTLFGLMILLAVLLDALPDPVEEMEADRRLYCTMVKLHMDDPRIGWPDYRGVYAEVCDE